MSRKTGPSKKTVELVIERDERCPWCGRVNYPGAFQIHHRRPRGAGGSRRDDTNSPANLVALCMGCHALIESHRDVARERGFLVAQCHDPAERLLRDYLGRKWWLLPDGTRHECTDPKF